MPQRKTFFLYAALAIFVIIIGILYIKNSSTNQIAVTSATGKSYSSLTINLKDGKLQQSASTYLVRQGTNLQFTINSNVFGQLSLPTTPPETIHFTQSPLVFRVTASKVGNFPLLYQANDSNNPIRIGTILVHAN